MHERDPFSLSSADTVRQVGAHITWLHEPDVFGMRLSGPIRGDELAQILDLQIEWMRTKPAYFVLCDVSKLGDVSRDARKVMSDRLEGNDNRVTSIVYGATFAVRVLADMVNRARKAFRTSASASADSAFVTNETEARALLEKLRAARQRAQ